MSVLPPPLSPQWAPPARNPGASCAASSSSTPTGASTQRDLKKLALMWLPNHEHTRGLMLELASLVEP